MMHRRGFLTGVFSAFAAPAIVRFDSIMPVKVVDDYEFLFSGFEMAWPTDKAMAALLRSRIIHAYEITKANLITNIFERSNGESPLDSLA